MLLPLLKSCANLFLTLQALRSRPPADSRTIHKVFHSTPDLQNCLDSTLRNTLSQEDLSNAQNLQSSQDPSLTFIPQQSQHSMGVLNRSTPADSSTYSSAGYYVGYQQPRVVHGSLDHRKLRRSQSAINSSQLCTDENSPPLPVAGQVVRVDVGRSKGEYASVAQNFVSPGKPETMPTSPGVMSSFRPSDCAKLYASPEQIKTVGYRNPEMLAQLNQSKNGNGSNSKNRSQSLPPSTNRPPVNRPSPEKDTSMDSGIYSSTHSTFRSGEVEYEDDDEEDLPLPPPPPEAEITYARPQNNKVVGDHDRAMTASYTMSNIHSSYSKEPVTQMSASYSGPSSIPSSFPDPCSSDEESTYNSQYEESKKALRKKKHTVAFAPTVVTSNGKEPSPYAAPLVTKTNSPPTASSPPLPPPPASASDNFSDLIAKKAAEKRLRRENSSGSAPGSATASPNRKVTPPVKSSKGLSDAILESALFNKQKERANGVEENGNSVAEKEIKESNGTSKPTPITTGKLKNSKSYPSDFPAEENENSSSGVSSDHEVQRGNAFVTVINTESNTISESKPQKALSKSNSIEESSVSSESSEDASDRTWILSNECSEKSDSAKETNSKKSGSLTRNAVSLVKLPPPQENPELNNCKIKRTEQVPSKDEVNNVSSESNSLQYQKLPSSHPLASSHPLPYHLQGAIHPSNTHVGQAKFSTLQRPSSKRFTKAGSDPPSGQTARSSGGGTLTRSRSITRDQLNLNSGSATLDRNRYQSGKGGNASLGKGTEYEQSIDQSLQLIRMHMNSLNEVNNLAGIPSTKSYNADLNNGEDTSPNANKSSSEEVLAPPPQFSDPAAQYKNQFKSGGNSDEEDEEPIRVHKRSNRRLEEEFASSGRDGRSFRNKTLDEWSTKDTTDWLESIFMPEYKHSFENKQIDGAKLLKINNESLINLGVRRVGHRVNMEKSLKRYRAVERIDL